MLRPFEHNAIERFGLLRHFAHFLHLAVAVKHDIAAGEQSGFCTHGNRAGKRVHRQVIGHQEPVERHLSANHIANHFRTGRRRTLRIDRVVDDMCRHRHRALVEAAEGDEVGRAELLLLRGDMRQRQMGVRGRAAVAGDMLHHRQHTTIRQSCDDGATESDDGCRIG